jgi:hypothetical protein
MYSADEIDFLVAYIFPENTWYVLPVREVENHKSLCVTPGSKHSRYEQYREAWKLMKPAVAIADVAVDAGASAASKSADTWT